MSVPDFRNEIMLMSVGFTTYSVLTKKITTLYSCSQQLLYKQHHHDCGLNPVKSVLVVACSFRSVNPGMFEDTVLMRALRDFNIPKIITNDLPVFLGLINYLFLKIGVPCKHNRDWETKIKKDTLPHDLQVENQFICIVVELNALLDLRHSIFIIGDPGTGKIEVWFTLSCSNSNCVVDLNPKVITRDWQDGLFSTIMDNLWRLSHPNPN